MKVSRRRLLIAVVVGVLLWQTPALASLSITDRQQAATELTTGPQFFAFDTGQPVLVGAPTAWADFTFEGLVVDEESGSLVLGRAGDVAPTSDPWHSAGSSSRACEAAQATGVRALTFDMDREIEAGRLRSDLADIRVYDLAGAAAPFRIVLPTDEDAGSVVVVTELDVPVCVYWGDSEAASQSDPSVQGPVLPDGGWSWQVWEDVGDGLSLDLVDWSTPSATGVVPSGSSPADVCNQCANELVGFVTPAVSGDYRFFLSADDVGRLELAPAEDATAFATIVELSSATPAGDFSDPSQVSAPVSLVADQPYAIRARSKDLEFDDHLEIAWALDGEQPETLAAEEISDTTAVAGNLTHHRFDLVATTDLSGPPASSSRIESSQNTFETCDVCAHSLAGYVVVADAGSYRFWISSDDEGSLYLATNGDPGAATRVAWLTNFTEPNNWTADPTQGSGTIELAAGQTIWIEAVSRDRGGPDHLQVAWSRVDTDPATDPALIPSAELSQNPPTPAPLPTFTLGPVEGQQATQGSFQSSAIDTTTGGSNVFGSLILNRSGVDAADAVTVQMQFSDDPAGPWSDPIVVVEGRPAPLSADGLRYVRASGSISSGDTALSSFGLERDLREATAVDATTTVSVPGVGDHTLLRVRGAIGLPASAALSATSTAGISSWLSGAIDPIRVETLGFDGTASHHIGITVDAGVGPTSTTMRWTADDGQGVTVVHDLVIVVEGA